MGKGTVAPELIGYTRHRIAMMCMTANLVNAFLLRVVVIGCQWQRGVEYCSAFALANQAPVRWLLNKRCDENEQRALGGRWRAGEKTRVGRCRTGVAAIAQMGVQEYTTGFAKSAKSGPKACSDETSEMRGLRAVVVLWTNMAGKEPCRVWG